MSTGGGHKARALTEGGGEARAPSPMGAGELTRRRWRVVEEAGEVEKWWRGVMCVVLWLRTTK